MFLANADPDADLAVMAAARENLRQIAPKQLVLISSIAVYADSRGKDEQSPMTPDGLPAYGRNRLQLERWVREDYPNALIVRLPALYGIGLKKNFLFDLHTITPAMLKPEKYDELAAKSPLVQSAYTLADNGFYKLNGTADKTALKEAIDKAEAFKEGKLESDYDNYKNFTDVIVTAKMYYESDRYTQEQLDGVKDRLIAAQEKVTKADASEEKVQLDKLIEQAEALESDMFTEESWTPVETALTEAKAIDDGLKSEYNAAIEKLNTALKGLVGIELPTVPAGKPFVKVYKRGTTATVLKTTADKDMAKAVKIRVTFDCAEDVSYLSLIHI